MRLEGRIIKSGKFWAVEVPLLMLFTQGRTRKEAFEMAKDAVEGMVDRKAFEASAVPADDDRFMIGSNDEKLLLATVLRQQRAGRGLTVRDVATRLGASSPTAYARYETGKVNLSLEKFSELMHAIDSESEAVLNILRKHG
jgi:predicted RNase H-like HicB family nuclease/DNA-binding XRE family transcriptional regulator